MTTSRVHKLEGQTPTGNSGLPEHIYGKAFGTTRSSIRRILLNLGRKETKLLSGLQRVLRCNILDAYFIATGALGDHLTFVLLLPNFFLFGFSDVGRVMANLLLYGVVVSSALKDYLCLPRPDSPPVQRLSMNKSHSLEYGFPSTHTTNCVALGLASHLQRQHIQQFQQHQLQQHQLRQQQMQQLQHPHQHQHSQQVNGDGTDQTLSNLGIHQHSHSQGSELNDGSFLLPV
ncbi:Long-chain base-1-phosphate phosphatase [Basidiobolus ranarum]|uniref:Long-chain base-1-phosphate phosphatase n=1 Tax=Basidiobolus ranarum TaxID=34480 RepID=A0ABR2VZ26_9FUNG